MFCELITVPQRTNTLVLSNVTPVVELAKGLKSLSENKAKAEFFRGVRALDISANGFLGHIDSLKEVLRAFPKVKELSLAGIGLAEDVVEIIGDIPKSTTSLALAHNGITADICNGLMHVFPKKVRILKLDENWMGLSGLYNMRPWFSRNGGQLRVLNIEYNKLFRDEHDTRQFVQVLEFTTHLEELCIGQNSMHDEDLKLLCPAIGQIAGLKVLDLQAGQLTKDAAECVVQLLGKLGGLAKLNFFSNALQDEGAGKIFENLGLCPSLRFLNMSGNKMRGECLGKLADFAANKYTGAELVVWMMGNMISPDKKAKLHNRMGEIRTKKQRFALDVKFALPKAPKTQEKHS